MPGKLQFHYLRYLGSSASLMLEEGPFPLVHVGALELVVEHGHVELQRAYQVLAQLAAFEMGCLGNQSKKYFSTLESPSITGQVDRSHLEYGQKLSSSQTEPSHAKKYAVA